MLNHAYKMVYLYQYIFDDDANVSSILFKFFGYELFASINGNKIRLSKICINLA